MKRYLPAAVIAFLMLVVATPVNAGYLVIRIILESTGGSETPGTTGPGVPGGPSGIPGGGKPIGIGGPPQGSGMGPPGGVAGQPMGNPMGNPMGTPSGSPAPHVHAGLLDPTRSVVVVVPVEEDLTHLQPFYAGKQIHQNLNPGWSKLHITLHDEKIVTNLFTDSTTIQWYSTLKEIPGFLRTHAKDVREAYAKWAKTKADSKAGYTLMLEALRHGLVDEAMQCADDLLTTAREKKDNLPEVTAFLKAYGAMQKGIKGGSTKPSTAPDDWSRILGSKTVTPSQHYMILSWDADEREIHRSRVLLEEHFKAFFLWHASRGIELPVPQTAMVVVLASQGRQVLELARVLDGPTRLPADGFYSAEHGVLVLSPERLDSVGLTFATQTQQMFHAGFPRKDLLAGKGPEVDVNGQNNKQKPDDVARMQTIALVERLVDENAAVCAISREGSLQLLYATGQLPKYVSLPEWLTNGAVNFFTRPKDPAFVTGPDKKPWMTVAATTGYGGPNYVQQRQFKEYFGDLLEEKRDRKEVPEQSVQRVQMLKNLLADAYFLGLRDARDVNDPDPVKLDKSGVALNSGTPQNPNPGTGVGPGPGPGTGPGPQGPRPPMGGGPGPMGFPSPMGGSGSLGGPPMTGGPGPMGIPGTGTMTPNTQQREDPIALMRKKYDKLSIKAQATSWALYYYLVKDRPTELRAFVAELSALPRDLPLDSATMTAAFNRAFGLDGSNQSHAKFADDWMAYLRTVPPAGVDIPLVDPKPSPSGGTTPGGITPGGITPPMPPGVFPKGGAGGTGR